MARTNPRKLQKHAVDVVRNERGSVLLWVGLFLMVIVGEFLHCVVPGDVEGGIAPSNGTAMSIHRVPNDPAGMPTR